MNDARLMRKIIEYGADESGINDRFMGNAELYISCLREFVDEPNFGLLEDALTRKDDEAAFEAAHALKGLSGNLGATACYEAICALVETLRARREDGRDEQYAAVVAERDRLRWLLTEQDNAPAPATPKPKPDAAKAKKRMDRFIATAAAVMLVLLVFVSTLFVVVINDYNANVADESALHLLEINQHVRRSIEEQIMIDWRTARSVGDSIVDSNFVDDDDAIFDMITRKRDVWGLSDIILYTESGDNIRSNGSVESNDIASGMVVRARAEGEHLTVIDSSLVYTVPIETTLRYRGSRIAAVSVVREMQSYLDDMQFSAFSGRAWMYLTEDNGIVVSVLYNAEARWVFNVNALFDEQKLQTLLGDTSSPTTGVEPSVYIIGEERPQYLVCMPITTQDEPMRLFYFAPCDTVNGTMNDFSNRLVLMCVLVILGFALAGLLVFASMYMGRRKRFDADIQARERMFELLTQNTQTAFGLFAVNSDAPDYISGNAREIVGDANLVLQRRDGVYSMQSASGLNAEPVRRLNESMRGWDGASAFRSPAIRNDHNNPETFFEVQLYPTADERYVGLALDVTHATERETVTRDALAMAERANDAKSRFLSNMSHDIRTPMNAIVNMTSFAQESIGEPKKLAIYLQTIRESSDHLLRLINDVLDVSRIESGQMTVSDAPFDVRAELKRQADIVRPLCAEKGLTLITDFDDLNVEAVRGDQVKFSQILMNLLGNAVKFTPAKGAVRFSAKENPSLREEIVDLRVTVEDNGIGMSPETIAHVFEPFTRADDKRVSRIEGTGLGLSICHSYVTAMGGTIQCESELGEGSMFTLELFFQRATEIRQTAVDARALGDQPFLGMRCLVAEDNGVNQMIARKMLERVGFMVEIVGDGADCLGVFLASKPGYFDVIYMDIQMPVMDGYQAAVAIRASEHPQATTVPMIAMTANVFAEDIEKARIAGMDGHLGKPMTTLSLIEETYRVTQSRKEDRK